MNPFEAALMGNLDALSPSQTGNIQQGFTRRTELPPDQESLFQHLMMQYGRGNDITDPTYDARGAYAAGMTALPGMHGSSAFKGLGDERLMLPLGPGGSLLDTRTMTPPDPQLVNLWRVISGVMNK
jgi:hypothetical protein